MQQSKTDHIKHSPSDRRSLSDRRCFDKGWKISGKERRKTHQDRRKGWEYFPKDWPC
ncbi:MAG: hypothetical protein GY857_12705 [Desulfobacula sp.]|nr:hypothetical protein [Desulfobacula sp.]